VNNLDHHINSKLLDSQELDVSGNMLNVFNNSSITLFSLPCSQAFSLTISQIFFKSSFNFFLIKLVALSFHCSLELSSWEGSHCTCLEACSELCSELCSLLPFS
jgi:hypothetical protein